MEESNIGPDPVIIKPSRGARMLKSKAARSRRKETKVVKTLHSFKEDTDAKERLRAKRLLKIQKKRKLQKSA